MPDATPTLTLDLTPSPRILQVIAETDLKIYQCIAELADNCFDELRRATEADPQFAGRIDIQVPTASQADRNSEIVVADDGRGMTLEQMQTALKAGSTSNSQYGALGLFGMGFNIATARLGRTTEVKTGRAGDDVWHIATISLNEMQRKGTFQVPLRTEPKPINEHGTMITVSKLGQEIVAQLQKKGEVSSLKRMLGWVYSYMIRDPKNSTFSGADLVGGMGLSLNVNQGAVEPVLPCVWDPKRTVPYRGQETPAVLPIEHRLQDGYACMSCGGWTNMYVDLCPECESEDIQQRERWVRGWVGIQRYADASDFGISFIRQGRVIKQKDRTLFSWFDDDGNEDVEYPIERPTIGRIVGEIHIDHIPVNYRKTDFDRDSRAWEIMVSTVRGASPLKQETAKSLGKPLNDSPIGRLFNAYRRTDAGTRSLYPGDGSFALHAAAKEWGLKFRQGDPDYMTDEIWWDAAVNHDELKNRSKSSTEATPDDDATLAGLGMGHLIGDGDGAPVLVDTTSKTTSTDQAPVVPPKVETIAERFARYKEHATPLSALDGRVHLGPSPATLRGYLVSTGISLADEDQGGFFAIRQFEGETEVCLSADHPLINAYGWDPVEVALMCLVPPLSNMLMYQGPVDRGVLSILEAHSDRRLDHGSVRQSGENILESLRERLLTVVERSPEVYWGALSQTAKAAAERNAMIANQYEDWSSATRTGAFAEHLTPAAIKELLMAHPDKLMDGAVFTTTYASWSDENTRIDQIDRVAVLLGDLGRMLSVGKGTAPRELKRYLLSADLMADEVAE